MGNKIEIQLLLLFLELLILFENGKRRQEKKVASVDREDPIQTYVPNCVTELHDVYLTFLQFT